jgi:hypothetical protein
MFGLDSDGDGPFYGNGNFDTIYRNNDKRAGKYTYTSGNWNYTP